MKVVNRQLDGLVVFENRQFSDERGHFEEVFQRAKFQEGAPGVQFVQANHSRSKPGVVRGLHYQVNPTQGKLIGVLRGRIWDVALDVRRSSPTFGQHFGLELNDKNGLMLWIPAGFAHGFCALGEEDSDIVYFVDNYYSPAGEGGVVWNDPDLKIPWPLERRPIVSVRDQSMMTWSEFLQL